MIALGAKRVSADDVFNEFCFGREAVHRDGAPNRDLLLEFCRSRDIIGTNMF